MKEQRLKGWIGIFYLLLFIGLFVSGIKTHYNILSYIGFSCLGLSIRAFVFVYKKWNKVTKLTDRAVRGCLINYLFYYPLLVSVIFILVYIFNDKYRIAELNSWIFNLLSFYVGFDIVRVSQKGV